MSTFERYMFRRALTMTLATLAAATSIVWVVQALARVNVISDSSGSVVAFLRIATANLPSSVPDVVPFAVAIGLAQTLTAMNADSELTIINAAGASRATIFRPALALALCASLVQFAFAAYLAPASRLTMRTILMEARGDLLTSLIREGGFTRVDDKVFVEVAQRKPGGVLGGVFVADQRDPEAELVYYARQGMVTKRDEGSILVLEDGEVHRRAPNGDVSVIAFTSYAFNLDALKPTGKGGLVAFPKDRPFSYILAPPADDPIFKTQPGLFRIEVNQRLTSWLYSIAFALIVLAVAANPISHRQARIPPLLTALTLAGAAKWMSMLIEGRARGSLGWAAMQYAFPLALIVVVAILARSSRNLEINPRGMDRLGDARAWLAERWLRLRHGRHVPAGGGPR